MRTQVIPGSGLTRLTRCGLFAILVCAAACGSDPAVKKQQHFENGNRYFEQGQYAEAVIEYRNAVALDATFGQARKRLAESYARSGNARASLDEFVRAADLLPSDIDAQLTAGNLLLVAKRHEEALARADAALQVERENIDALVLRGNALAGLTSFDEALESIEEAIRLDPDRGATHASLGFVQLAQGRRDEAEAALRRAVSLSPTDTAAHLALGNFYWAVGRTKEAEQTFDAALRIDASNSAANRFMASFKLSTGRQAEAEPYLRQIAESSRGPEGVLTLADYYLSTRRPHDAIAALGRIEAGQKAPAVQLRLARAHAVAGDLDQARALVDQILRANSKDADAQLLRGQLLLQAGQREEAFAAIQTASTLAPSSADVQYALGRMYAQRGDRAAAQAAFQEVLRINPRASAAQVALAAVQVQPQESVRLAEEATRRDPENAAARLALVRSLMAARDLNRAEREIARLRADHPTVAAVHTQDAILALLKKDVTRARAALERAEELDAASIETLGVFMALELMQNNPAGARARLEARLKQGATPELLLLAGRTYQQLKDTAAAEQALRTAIDLDPSRNEPYALLGSIYISQQRLEEALEEFEALSKKQARPVGPLTMSGILHQQLGNEDAAIKRYEDALAVDQRAGVPANNLAWMLAERGRDLDRALQLAQTAVAAFPDTPQILDTLGFVYYKRELPAQAIPLFRQSAEKAPGVALYQYHLGLALLQEGDTDAGRAALRRALELKPSAAIADEIRRLLDSAG